MPISRPLGPLDIYVDTLTHSNKGQVILLKVILLIKANKTMETDPRSPINNVDILKQQHQSWRFYYPSVEKC